MSAVRLACLALLLAASPALAQTGLYLHVGAERTGFAPPALDGFTDTYNAYFSRRIVTPMPRADATVIRPVFGATVRYQDGLYGAAGYQYGRTRQTLAADLGSGLGQELELLVLDHTVHIELGVDLGQRGYIAGVVSGLFRGEAVTFRTVYPDGGKSVGSETQPNGYFTAVSPDFGVGVAAGLRAGRLTVPVRAVFPVGFLSTSPLPMIDYDRQALQTYFPSDWPRYLEDRSGTDKANALQDTDFPAPHLSAGLELRLF